MTNIRMSNTVIGVPGYILLIMDVNSKFYTNFTTHAGVNIIIFNTSQDVLL